MTIPNRPLLQTKLHRPRVTRNLVVRRHLLARLDRGLSCPLTLVCTAAGFGKTTLVSEWADQVATGRGSAAPTPTAWLSLDESDCDLDVFLRYWIAALRTIFVDACAETARLIQARRQPPLNLLVATLCNELAVLPQDFVFVLEDYHVLRGEAVHDLMNEMVRYWPQPMHLVIVSRHDPALPLASLRATERIVEIRGRDLRFTNEETEAYLRKALPAALGQPAIALLEQRTEGWIAGLQLASLSLAVSDNAEEVLATLSAPDADVSGYLADEVLSHQPAAIQSFLLRTSILDHFCVPLCEVVTEIGDAEWHVRACMDWLERADLFVVALDQQRVWYRYHHLFRDMLQQRALTALGAEQMNELHRRAAAWYAGQSLVDEALGHALAAGDLDLAARLIEQGLPDVLNREDRATLERWLRLMPEEYVQRRPGLLMLKAWALAFSWQLDAQSKVLGQIEALMEQGAGVLLSADDLLTLRGQIVTLQAQEAYFGNQPALALACCQEALTLLPNSWTFVRGAAMMYLGLSMQASGEGRAAERMLLDAYEPLGDKTGGYALRLLMTLGFYYYLAGNLEQTAQVARVMFQQATSERLAVLQGWAHYYLGFVHYQWNDLDAAAQYFAGLIEQRYSAQVAAVRDGAAGLALIHQIRGESSEACQMVESLGRADVERLGHEADTTAALRAELRLRQGDVEGASRWADALPLQVPDRPLIWFVQPYFTKVRILLTRNLESDVQVALQTLEALQAIAERTFNTRAMIEILALRAVALDSLGNAGDAEGALQQAVELSRPGGFIRVFVDQGWQIQHLLGRLAKRGFAPATIRRILAAFPGQRSGVVIDHTQEQSLRRPSRPQDSTPIAEPLTARELEILALLCEPLSAKEVARNLGISPSTVKRHTVNLYAKLGVNSRWGAVARATALGILPPR